MECRTFRTIRPSIIWVNYSLHSAAPKTPGKEFGLFRRREIRCGKENNQVLAEYGKNIDQ